MLLGKNAELGAQSLEDPERRETAILALMTSLSLSLVLS